MSTGTLPEQPVTASQDRELLDVLNVLTSLCAGDFAARAEPRDGLAGQLVERVNQLATLQERRTRELVRASRVIGREGRMTERLDEVGSEGDWSTGRRGGQQPDRRPRPARPPRWRGSSPPWPRATCPSRWRWTSPASRSRASSCASARPSTRWSTSSRSFADEVTRVAREVGTEGKLGGQAQVRGVSGVWRDLTESVNSMAGNLTSQVRNIAQVTTAVAQGDLSPEDHRRRPRARSSS